MKIEISPKSILVAFAIGLGLLALARAWAVVLLLIVALIIMAALLPVVNWLVARRVPRLLAALMVLLGVIGAVVGLVAALAPAVISELGEVREQLPEHARRLEELVARFGVEVDLEAQARDFEFSQVFSGRLALSVGQQVLVGSFAVLTVFVFSLYLLVGAPKLAEALYHFFDEKDRPDVQRVLAALQRAVGAYIRGQLIVSGVIALYTFILLTATGVPNAYAYALLAGMVDVIPMFGATLAVAMPTAAALGESMTTGIIVASLMIGYQQFEDRLLVPKVYGQALRLPGFAILLAVLIGGAILGFAGVLLALPAVASGKVLIDYWAAKRGGRFAEAMAGGAEQPSVPGAPEPVTGPDAQVRASRRGPSEGKQGNGAEGGIR